MRVERMKFAPCGCDSYGGTCPQCLAISKQAEAVEIMATCKHGHTGNCQLCLSELRMFQPKAAQSKPDLDNPKLDSALDRQIGGEHYKDCKVQPIQFIEANALGFLEGCVVKRVTRHNKATGKGRQDIEKAIHELQLLLELRYPISSGEAEPAKAERPWPDYLR